jgi:hypothetical protein
MPKIQTVTGRAKGDDDDDDDDDEKYPQPGLG